MAKGISVSRPRPLPRRFFAREATEVAPDLLGKLLVREDGRAARLVEVEAYMGQMDPGSHAFRGPTPRASIMFGAPGHLYVYFSYGAHWCANIVCSPAGVASAVLLRAAQPLAGLDAMRAARAGRNRTSQVPRSEMAVRDLCRGPGRLAQAFSLSGEHNGLDIVPARARSSLLWLADDGEDARGAIAATARIGLAAGRGDETPWRYVIAGSSWASGRRPGAPSLAPGPHGTALGQPLGRVPSSNA